MTTAALALVKATPKKGSTFRTYADVAAKALSLRPGWKQLDSGWFRHESGRTIGIAPGDSVASVTLGVVLTELWQYILEDPESDRMLTCVVDEFVMLSRLDRTKLSSNDTLVELTWDVSAKTGVSFPWSL